jgi:hypothetical protein
VRFEACFFGRSYAKYAVDKTDQKLDRIIELLEDIAKNTKPEGRAMRILELIALLVGISGILAAIEQIIEWVRRIT